MQQHMNIKLYIAIGIGGMIGAVARYSISMIFMGGNGFPYGTLIANLIGCFLLSFLLNHHRIKQKLPVEILSAISVGVIGAFTTFSTFAVETIGLWSTNALVAITYTVMSVCLGLLFCYGGYRLATGKRVGI